MIFAVMGFFKEPVQNPPEELQAELNEHVSQRLPRIRLAGFLRNQSGERTGLMAVIEADDFSLAESYLQHSPYFAKGLYARTEVVEYDLQVGALR